MAYSSLSTTADSKSKHTLKLSLSGYFTRVAVGKLTDTV
jgi:hypothetical protein